MREAQTAPICEPSAAPEAAHELTHDEFYRAALNELVTHGLVIVRTLAAQAKADPIPHPFWGDKAPIEHPTAHLTSAYERMSRSIRRTITLARTLSDPPPRPAQPRTPAARAAPGSSGTERPSRGPEPEPPEAEQPDQPESNRPERDEPDCDEPEFPQDAGRPVATVLTEIRQDRGLHLSNLLEPLFYPDPASPAVAFTPASASASASASSLDPGNPPTLKRPQRPPATPPN